MAISNPPPAGFGGNRWTELEVPALAEWTPSVTVSVILPYFESPDALALSLAALSEQTYPRELTELVVADDGSDPPASIPEGFSDLNVKVIHQENRGFGLARARNTGAATSEGEILLFLDSDMVAEPGWLEAHARWHHLVADSLTLGFRRHVSFDGISADAVRKAVRANQLGELLRGRRQETPDWIEYHMIRLKDLTSSDDDLFRIVTGGNLGIRRETFERTGRFDESFQQWGLEDTEFGYRAFTLGNVLIPERAAACWHQGLGIVPDQAEKASQEEQRARASHLIPERSFRPTRPGRSYEVPMAVVELSAGEAAAEQVAALLNQVLASSYHDLAVVLDVTDDHPDRELLTRRFGPDPRVEIGDIDLDQRFRFSPVRIQIPSEVAISSRTIGSLVEELNGAGLVEIPVSADSVVRAVKVRALRRTSKLGGDPWEGVTRLYGRRQLRPSQVGIRPAKATLSLGRLVPPDSKAGKVAYRMGQIRSPSDAWLFLKWLIGALRWRIQTKLPQRPSALLNRAVPRTNGWSTGPLVATLGDAGRNWLPDAAELQQFGDGTGAGVDVLLVDPGAVESLSDDKYVSAALESGARAVTVGDKDIYATVPPVDTSVFNPVGFRARATDRFAVLAAEGLNRPLNAQTQVTRADILSPSVDVTLPSGWRINDYPDSPTALVDQLRPYRAVIDDPVLHASGEARASGILSLGGAGVPVIAAELPGDLRSLIGPRVAAALEEITPESVADDHIRELQSITLRRAILAEHSASSRTATLIREAGIPFLRPPAVSVLLVTNRPDQLPHAISQLVTQTYATLEVVMVLHGFEDIERSSQVISASLPEAEIIPVAADLTFGDAFNAGTLASSGELIVKMDDDDWYGPEHITDLVLARDYTGATLTAKGAEFVFLEGSDITLRRFVGGAESYSSTVGGGAMLIGRTELMELGGWPRVRRHLDQALISLIERRGGRVYRTHGFGYVLVRHDTGHTWEADDEYFTAQAEAQRPGLDLEWAGAVS